MIKPAIVFLDAATSALDDRAEARLYELLRKAPWQPTIVSASHRSDLRSFHDQILNLSDFNPVAAYAQPIVAATNA